MRMLGNDQVEGPDLHQLWTEALWGIGLIGGVLGVVAVLAIVFGR